MLKICHNKALIKILLTNTLVILIQFTTLSQQSLIDSLNRIIKNNIPDTTTIDIINEFAYKHSSNYPHYIIPYTDIAINKSIDLNDSSRLSRSLNRKAVAYYFMGDYNNALDYYFRSLMISEKLNDSLYIATDYNNIGLVLIEEQLFDEALRYFIKAKNLLDSIDNRGAYAKVLDNIGIAYYSVQKYDSALVWFQKSLKINREISQRQTMASNIKNVGNVFRHQGNFQLAKTHYDLAFGIYKELGQQVEMANLLNKLAFVSTNLGLFNDAKEYLFGARELNVSIKSKSIELENIRIEAEYFNQTGKKQKSIKQLKRYIELKDSIQLFDKRKNYEQLKIIAETNEKIKDLELLRIINSIQKEKIKNQRTIQIGTVILLVLSILIILLSINALRTKNIINKRLELLVDERTAELKLAKEQAELSDKLKTAFLQNISHEVRTPMNAIVGFSGLLITRDYPEKERIELLKNISSGTIRLLKLFEKISYLAQLENNAIRAKWVPCSVKKILEDLYLKHKSNIEIKGLSIQLNIDEKFKQRIFDLPENIIESSLNELIENAIKFSKQGEISVWAKNNKENIVFQVSDHGEGIHPDQINLVFDKFIKFKPLNIEINEGAGLGLTIAKENVKLVGGNISITSKLGKGTMVEFNIPFA